MNSQKIIFICIDMLKTDPKENFIKVMVECIFYCHNDVMLKYGIHFIHLEVKPFKSMNKIRQNGEKRMRYHALKRNLKQ